MSRDERGDALRRGSINGGGEMTLLQLCPKHKRRRSLASLEMTGYENYFRLLGKSWKGGEALVPKCVTPRSLLLSPLCHPERSEGSPIQLRGLDITPSKLPRENIKGGDSSLCSE